jgi:soluble lytic murein transglycosylase
LRRYARRAPDDELRGLAYLALGYREYRANSLDRAREDLDRAEHTGCTLSDIAEYYEALADQRLQRRPEAIALLQGLLRRQPGTAFRMPGATVLADLLVQTGRPTQAIQLLKKTPGSEDDPATLLAFAKAYQAESNQRQAATVYEEVYYEFPLSPSANDAESALNGLRLTMGSGYPQVSVEKEAARAQRLLLGGQFEPALEAYSTLLEKGSNSLLTNEWLLDRARCLLGLRRYDVAAESLLNAAPGNPAADARRLRLLVRIYQRADDEPSMLNALDELYRQYPSSSSYADALYFAGDYFARHGFWQTAKPYFQRLAQGFPNALWAPQAAWWVSWYTLLDGKSDQAAAALESYLQRHPNSVHVPAALFWLARIRQEQGLNEQAQTLYHALGDRFPNNYYGLKARGELEASSRALRRPASEHGPSGVAVSTHLAIVLAPLSPPALDLSKAAAIYAGLTQAVTLAQLSLGDLVNQVLPKAIQDLPGNPDLFFALARLQSDANQPALALFAARRAVPNYQDFGLDDLPREEWGLLYPRAYWNLVRTYTRIDHLNPYLVMGLIRQESAFDPQATSHAGARGLMQMSPGTASEGIRSRSRRRRLAGLLYDPRYNIRLSSRYLRDLFNEFDGNPEEALAAYNAGDVRVREWLANGKYRDAGEFVESIPFSDTRAYVQSVLRDAAIYRLILTGRAKMCRPRS